MEEWGALRDLQGGGTLHVPFRKSGRLGEPDARERLGWDQGLGGVPIVRRWQVAGKGSEAQSAEEGGRVSVKAMSHVFDHSPYKGTERLIHLAIADVVNDGYDYQFWMSQKRVAAKARCSRQTVNIAIKKMVKDGRLSVVENPG